MSGKRKRSAPVILTWHLALWGFALPMLLIAAGTVGAWAQAQTQRDDIRATALVAKANSERLEKTVTEHTKLVASQRAQNRKVLLQICEAANEERRIVANLVIGISRVSPNLSPQVADQFADSLLELRPKDCEKAVQGG